MNALHECAAYGCGCIRNRNRTSQPVTNCSPKKCATVTLTNNGVAGYETANLLVADALQCNATVFEAFINGLEQLALLFTMAIASPFGEVEELGMYGVQVKILEEHIPPRPCGMCYPSWWPSRNHLE